MKHMLVFGDESRLLLKKGIDKIANAVGSTMGPKGKQVILHKQNGSILVTKDGVTVAREIKITDPIEAAGAALIKEVASKTNDIAGDGTTTATVLARAIIEEGLRCVSFGANAMELRQGLELGLSQVKDNLELFSQDIFDFDDLEHVASISANDPEIGKLIADAIKGVSPDIEAAKDVVLTIEESNTTGFSFESVAGLKVDNGYLSPYFITNPERRVAEYEDVPILVVHQTIRLVKEIMPILEALVKAGEKKLLIITTDCEAEALATIVLNKIKGKFASVIVKAPGFGNRKKDNLRDVAVVTGSTFITYDAGLKIEDTKLEHLGRAKKVIVSKDSTVIIGGAGKEEDILNHLSLLEKEREEADGEFDKKKLSERIGRIRGGVAVVQIGADTETARKELFQRVEDAINATRCALQEGVVPGGGVALLRASGSLDPQGNIGLSILKNALTAPLRQIASNAGKDGGVVVEKVSNLTKNEGYNAAKDVYEDLIIAGVIDPTKVVRVALEAAVSIASLVITSEAVADEVLDETKCSRPHEDED